MRGIQTAIFLKLCAEKKFNDAQKFISTVTDISPLEILNSFKATNQNNFREARLLPVVLNVNSVDFPHLFEFILFKVLLPTHQYLVMHEEWEEALNFELNIAFYFLKQTETEEFAEKTYKLLFQGYSEVLSKNSGRKDTPKRSEKSKLLFLLTNNNRLAHNLLFVNFLKGLKDKNDIFIAWIRDSTYKGKATKDTVSQDIENLGFKILAIPQSLGFAQRYKFLANFCLDSKVDRVVTVSVLANSAFLKMLLGDIQLIWWSMKYPLGSVGHFDRYVCNRSITVERRVFNGRTWECGPFCVPAIKKRRSVENSLNDINNFLTAGVLARSEKFLSSSLPEVLNSVLLHSKNLKLFWTGDPSRTSEIENLRTRLCKDLDIKNQQRQEFAGWVVPEDFINKIDFLIDTPNIGGSVVYQAMSIDKIVISAGEKGAIAALASKEILCSYFELLDSPLSTSQYFSQTPKKPFFLAYPQLIINVIDQLLIRTHLIEEIGRLFGDFYRNKLSDNYKSSSQFLTLLK